jgi:hypothetical protein
MCLNGFVVRSVQPFVRDDSRFFDCTFFGQGRPKSMKFSLKKRATVVAATALAAGLTFGGVAFAQWLSTGTGSGSTKAVTAVAMTTSDPGTVSAQLYPGATNSGSLSVKINNPNPYPVTVTSITGNGTVTATGGTGTCSTTGVSLSTISNITDAVPANSSSTFTHDNVVSMSNSSDDGCQGATFSIPVSLSGHSG